MAANFLKGIIAERFVILWLRCCGYTLVKHRLRTPFGELDAVMTKDKCLLFLEVKFRSHATPLDQILSNRQNIRNKRAIGYYYRSRGYDVLGFRVKYDLYYLSLLSLPKRVEIDLV